MTPVVLLGTPYLSTNRGIIRLPFDSMTEQEYNSFERVSHVKAYLNPSNYVRRPRKNGGRNRKMTKKQRLLVPLPYELQMAIYETRLARKARNSKPR